MGLFLSNALNGLIPLKGYVNILIQKVLIFIMIHALYVTNLP